jgi:hypothetical protein
MHLHSGHLTSELVQTGVATSIVGGWENSVRGVYTEQSARHTQRDDHLRRLSFLSIQSNKILPKLYRYFLTGSGLWFSTGGAENPAI